MFRLSYPGSEKLDDDLTQGKLFWKQPIS
jgi:hypothetical protein